MASSSKPVRLLKAVEAQLVNVNMPILKQSIGHAIQKAKVLINDHQWVGVYLFDDLKMFLNCLKNFNSEMTINNRLLIFRAALHSVETMLTSSSPKPIPTIFEEYLRTMRKNHPKKPTLSIFEKKMTTGSIVYYQLKRSTPVQCIVENKVKVYCPVHVDVDLTTEVHDAKQFVSKLERTIKLALNSTLPIDQNEVVAVLKSLIKMMAQDALWVLKSSDNVPQNVKRLRVMLKQEKFDQIQYDEIMSKLSKSELKHIKRYGPYRKGEDNFWYKFEPRLGHLAQVPDNLLLQKKELLYRKCNK